MRNHSKASLFLMEFIITILFFSLTAAVCVRIYVSSHLLSSQSVDCNHACMWAENVAELFYGTDTTDALIEVLAKEEKISPALLQEKLVLSSASAAQQTSRTDAASLQLYFTKDWSLITDRKSLTGAAYCLQAVCSTDSSYHYAEITVLPIASDRFHAKQRSTLYTLSCKKYLQKGASS